MGTKKAEFWDKRSEKYDREVLEVYDRAYKKTIRRSLAFLKPEDRLLEIGCGTGNVTIPLGGRVREILAVDPSFGMMEQARKKADELGRDNITFQQGGIWEVREEPESFDAIAAYNVLLYMKDREKVLDRIYELLKPGGIFLSATDCLGRNLSPVAVRKLVKSTLGLMPYVAFETPVGLMKKIEKHGFLVLEAVNLHRNPPNLFFVAQKIEKK